MAGLETAIQRVPVKKEENVQVERKVLLLCYDGKGRVAGGAG